MDDTTDPRSALTQAHLPHATHLAGADYIKFYQIPPAFDDKDGRFWHARGQNFLVAYTETKAGALLKQTAQPDEYAALLLDPDTRVTVQAGGQTETMGSYRIAFVPSGASFVQVRHAGPVIWLFSSRANDLTALCANAASYAAPQPNTIPLQAWPEPADGYRTRSYSLDVPPSLARFGRVFRCTTLMVNYLDPWAGPRDRTKLSPHHHDDFQQGSLALAGEFIHHLCWPWTTDMNRWRNDDHELCGSPSLAVIPPPSIHTTQAISRSVNQPVDVFSPPRLDLSLKPGRVMNADDYPIMPQ